ncbi:Sodium/calcium exchanger family protein isoform 2 [Theobroma cacao]|uniref:Sodium/calcium exchanger family protein isoform 2 n=1 Tax=Theobroma cacao TaxID=3641 RepID=A0A061F0L8_THECC|nr:Sodium/calcium exchanger family protein isoform 2 [Theobroma cacao]
MGTLVSISEHKSKRYIIFLNISFLLVACVFLMICFRSSGNLVLSGYNSIGDNQQDCKLLEKLDDYKAKCSYLKSNNPCVSQGYVDYLYLFYCNFGRFPLLGHCLLVLWLLVLFYLLGNTASEYFCYSLESLSSLLKLSPTLAGVTLLSLGNGAPDVFSSIASFMDSGTEDVGLNTVLGGAFFVTCVVVGTISTLTHRKRVQVNKPAFVRDVCYILLVLASLSLILVYGKINLWGAMTFSSMYILYVIIVYIMYIFWNSGGMENIDSDSSYNSGLSIPLLTGIEKVELDCLEEGNLEDNNGVGFKKRCFCLRLLAPCSMLLFILQMPLDLPRRLTIPIACEERWSKPVAVVSVALAPILISVLWDLQDDNLSFNTSLLVYGIGFLFGITFGVLAYLTTENSSPPKKCLFPWLAGGFIMSVIWSYIIAQELVGLLISIGYLTGISHSILGLTVLAWGNSLGDLITNLTMALNGGPKGAQVAISGCYAGPIFNILFGLGISMIGSAWFGYPSPVQIPKDPYLLETLGFQVAALLWALLVLPMRDMRLDGVLGGGLFLIYLTSISLRLIQVVGPIQLHTVT